MSKGIQMSLKNVSLCHFDILARGENKKFGKNLTNALTSSVKKSCFGHY